MTFHIGESKNVLITFSFAAGALKDLTIDDIDLFTTVLKREGEVLRTEIHQRNYSYTPKGSDTVITQMIIALWPNDTG